MNCKEIQELMWCGEMTADVRAHLHTCERCRAEQATLQELGLAFEGVPIPKPSRSLLPASEDIQAVISSHKRRRARKWRAVVVVAACLALAVTQVPSLLHTKHEQHPNENGDPSLALSGEKTNPSLAPNARPQKVAPLDQIRQMLGMYQYSMLPSDPTILQTELPPTFEGKAGEKPMNLYYAYANVLSRHVNLDMTPYLGHAVEVYVAPLQEAFAGGRFEGYRESEVVAVFEQNHLIGIWQRARGGGPMASLDNQLFGEIRHLTWGEWAREEKLETRRAETKAWTPEQVISKYLEANNQGDRAMMSSLLSLSYQFYLLTNGVDRTTERVLVTDNYYGPFIEPSTPYKAKFVENVSVGKADVTSLALVRNRKPVAAKTYEVDGGPNAMFFTLTQEVQNGPWQIDNISTGP